MAPTTALYILMSLLISQVYGNHDRKPCNIHYGCNDASTNNGVAFMLHLLGNHLTSCRSTPEEEMYWVDKLNKCFNAPICISEPPKNCTTSEKNEEDDGNTDQGSNSEPECDSSGSLGDESTDSSCSPPKEIPKEENGMCDTSGGKPDQGTTGEDSDKSNCSESPNETPKVGKSNKECDTPDKQPEQETTGKDCHKNTSAKSPDQKSGSKNCSTSGGKPEEGTPEEDSGDEEHSAKPCQATTPPAINNSTETKPTRTPQSNQCPSDNESETDPDYYDYSDSDCNKEDYTKSAFWKPFVEAIIGEMCRCHSESRANKESSHDKSDKGSPKHHQSSRGRRSNTPRTPHPIAASPASRMSTLASSFAHAHH